MEKWPELGFCKEADCQSGFDIVGQPTVLQLLVVQALCLLLQSSYMTRRSRTPRQLGPPTPGQRSTA